LTARCGSSTKIGVTSLKKIREQRKLYEAAERAFAKAEAILDKIMAADTKPRDSGWHERGAIMVNYCELASDGKTTMCGHRRCVESGNPGAWEWAPGSPREWGSA
jgi:hypothetical protein